MMMDDGCARYEGESYFRLILYAISFVGPSDAGLPLQPLSH